MGVIDKILGSLNYKEPTAIQVRARRAMVELGSLPQFTSVIGIWPSVTTTRIPTEGILNMLNGCLVSEGECGLRLTWQLDSYETPAHSALLPDEAAINKFVGLMLAQAASTTR